jgi:ribosomal protein L19
VFLIDSQGLGDTNSEKNMKNIISDFNKSQVKKIKESSGFKIPNFKVGDTLSVKYKITEGDSTRIQAFNGIVIARTKSNDNYNKIIISVKLLIKTFF